MLRRILIIFILQCAFAGPVWAASCVTSLSGQLYQIEYTSAEQDLNGTGQFIPKTEMKRNTSVRERLFGKWGKVDCPAYITLRQFTPDLTDAERKPFCLVYDKEADTYTGFSEGERNAYLICKNPKTFCERVNATKAEAQSIARTGLDIARRAALATAQSALSPDGGAIFSHSSGALIVKGSANYISVALGASGTSLGATLSAPAVVAAGAVTLIGVGGAVYFCR